MKKTILTLSLALLPALMANDSYRTEVDLTGGYNKFDSASRLDSATFFGIRGTMYENEVNKYGLQVGYEGAFGVDYEGNPKDTGIHRLFSHLVIDGEEEYDISPYLFLGGGYEYLSDEIKGEPSQGFVDLGVGFKYYFNQSFNVSLETRALGKFDTRDLGFNTTLALGYVLGGKYEERIEPIEVLGERKTLETQVNENIENITMIEQPVKEITPINNKFTIVKVAHKPAVFTQEAEVYVDNTTGYVSEGSVQSGAYYVQLAAYNHTDTEPLMERLVAKGYDNALVHMRGNTSLVLVGPFMDKHEGKKARRALRSIKSDAFVTRLQ